MARPGAAGRLLVQQRERPRARRDGERTHAALIRFAELRAFTNRIKPAPVWVQREEGWTFGFSGDLRHSELARGQVEAGNVNALALGTGVGAEEDEELAPGRGEWQQTEREKENQWRAEVFHGGRKQDLPAVASGRFAPSWGSALRSLRR